jgi:hypothetical protein
MFHTSGILTGLIGDFVSDRGRQVRLERTKRSKCEICLKEKNAYNELGMLRLEQGLSKRLTFQKRVPRHNRPLCHLTYPF